MRPIGSTIKRPVLILRLVFLFGTNTLLFIFNQAMSFPRLKFLLVSTMVSAIAASATEYGIMLDCARKNCTVEMIKDYVDFVGSDQSTNVTAATDDTHKGFLTLHLSDNEGVADFSATDIANIRQYASAKNVTINPEIDIPSHMGGFFKQAHAKYGDEFVKKIAVNEDEVPGELNITEPAAIQFADSLLAHYMEMFKPATQQTPETHQTPPAQNLSEVTLSPTATAQPAVFSIGADEFWTNYGIRTIQFINHMDSILTANGFVTRIYNDLILKEYIDLLNKDIQVVYWAHDGAAADPEVREERIAKRASLPDLQAAGFKIIETNSYYLYFVPSPRNTNPHDLDYTVNDIDNWNLSRWDANYEGGLENYKNIVGAEIAIWREESEGVSDDIILQQTKRMFEAMKASIESDPKYIDDAFQNTSSIFKNSATEQNRTVRQNSAVPVFNKKSSSMDILLKEKSFTVKGQRLF